MLKVPVSDYAIIKSVCQNWSIGKHIFVCTCSIYIRVVSSGTVSCRLTARYSNCIIVQYCIFVSFLFLGMCRFFRIFCTIFPVQLTTSRIDNYIYTYICTFVYFFVFIESLPFVQSFCIRLGSFRFLEDMMVMMMSLFSRILCTVAVSFLYGEYVVLFSSGWCFLPSKHGLIVLT